MSTAVKSSGYDSDDNCDEEPTMSTIPIMPTAIPQKTATQNRWGSNIWSEWARRRNQREGMEDHMVPEDLQYCDRDELGCWLPFFVDEVRQKDGSEYPYNSVYQICCAIKRYLNSIGGELDVFNRRDETFARFNAALDNKMEECASRGYENKVRHTADPVTRNDEEMLWKTGVINADTAQGLSFAVFFYNCKIFNVIGKDEHWTLTADQYRFFVDPASGREAMEFQSKLSKFSTRKEKHRRDPIRYYGDPMHPRCVVTIFKKYLCQIPKQGHFYRSPNIRSLDGSITYSPRNIGYNKLRAYLKYMFKLAKINTADRKITTHSLKHSVTIMENLRVANSTSDFLLPLDPLVAVLKSSPQHVTNVASFPSELTSPAASYATMGSPTLMRSHVSSPTYAERYNNTTISPAFAGRLDEATNPSQSFVGRPMDTTICSQAYVGRLNDVTLSSQTFFERPNDETISSSYVGRLGVATVSSQTNNGRPGDPTISPAYVGILDDTTISTQTYVRTHNGESIVSLDESFPTSISTSPTNITVVTPSGESSVALVTSLVRSSWTQTPLSWLKRYEPREESRGVRNEENNSDEGISKRVKGVIDYVRNTGGGKVSLELEGGIVSKIQIEL